MKDFINILKYRRIALNLMLIIIFIFLSLYNSYAVPILFILTSNLYDILGYHFTLIRRQNYLPPEEFVKSYRIIQLMFDVTLILLLAFLFGWIPSLCGAILKIFGIQDLLYYFFLQKSFPKTWTWLKWTPLGFLRSELSFNQVLLQAVLGIVISLIVLIFYSIIF